MPIYEYKCKKCGVVFERLVSANTRDKVSCSKCGSNIVQKIISAASLRLSSSSAAAIPLGAHSGCASPSGFS